jgi:hypothetical protein
MLQKTSKTSRFHVGQLLLFTILTLTMTACLPPLEEQKTLIRKNEIRIRGLSSRAFIETWGPPAYEHREQTQFFVTEHGIYIPRFRVPLGESPKGWTSEIVSGAGYFLGYPDRGELLGFLEEEAYVFEVLGLGREQLVYREHLSAQQIHKIGKEWEREDRFKTPLEKSQSPSGK